MDPILEVKGLYKVFGEAPERAFSLIEKGVDKDDIFEQTGLTVGVNDVSLTINEGEIFCHYGSLWLRKIHSRSTSQSTH